MKVKTPLWVRALEENYRDARAQAKAEAAELFRPREPLNQHTYTRSNEPTQKQFWLTVCFCLTVLILLFVFIGPQ